MEWASGGSERTFDQSAANGKKEHIVPELLCRSECLLARESQKIQKLLRF